MKTFLKIGLMLFLCISAQSAFAKASDIPVKDFFRNPAYTSMQLSPDGKHIAMLSPINSRRNIVIMETQGFKNLRPVTGLKNQDIAGFFWANNDTIVFTMDSDGNEAFSLYKVDTNEKTPKIRTLVGANAAFRGIKTASIVHTLPNDPEHIIVQFNDRDVRAADLYKLPLDSEWKVAKRSKKGRNSKMELIAKNPGDVQSWIVDHDGEVRGAVSLVGLNGKFHYKGKGEKDFRVIREFGALEEGINPLGFDFDNKTMFVVSNIGRDKGAIYKYDPETNKLGDLIYDHDVVDVNGLMMSRYQKKLIGVTYFNDYPEVHYFDENEKALM